MSDAELPGKRRFWQLHLATMIVMALLAGGAMGLNFIKGIAIYSRLSKIDAHVYQSYGFPCDAFEREYVQTFVKDGQDEVDVKGQRAFIGGILINLLISILGIGYAGYLFESYFRRREGRHERA